MQHRIQDKSHSFWPDPGQTALPSSSGHFCGESLWWCRNWHKFSSNTDIRHTVWSLGRLHRTPEATEIKHFLKYLVDILVAYLYSTYRKYSTVKFAKLMIVIVRIGHTQKCFPVCFWPRRCFLWVTWCKHLSQHLQTSYK